MKPFVVLLAVALAVGGLFFALQQGGTDTEGGTPGGTDNLIRREAASQAEGDPKDTTLESLAQESRREVKAVEAAPTQVDTQKVAADPVDGIGDLTGRVVNEKGTPIAGAQVTLTLFGSQAFLMAEIDHSKDVLAETGDDGVYRFTSVPVRGGWSILADHGDFSKNELPNVLVVEGVESTVPDLILYEGSSVRGRVVDAGGAPIEGVRLILSENRFAQLTDAEEGGKYEALSDDDGQFVIQNVAPMQNYALAVVKDGFGTIQLAPLPVVLEEDTVREIVLEAAAMLGGTVTSSLGEPVIDAEVEAFAIDRAKRSAHTKAKTNDVGEFLLDDIPTGEFQLVVRHPRFATHSVTRARSGDMQVGIVLEPLPTISGRVVDATTGAPLTRFEVQLRQTIQGAVDGQTQAHTKSRTAFEDEEGRFELVAPKAGTYLVEGIGAGYANTYSEPFEVGMNEATSGIVVQMSKGGTISGRVLGIGGAPVAGAIVETHDKTWSSDPFGQMLAQSGVGDATDTSVRTNKDGEFELANLKGAGYQLRIRHGDYAPASVADLTLAEGGTLRVPDVRLKRGATITGTVLAPSGAPLAGAVVQALPMTAGFDVKRTRTGTDGTYELKNLPEGSYKIAASRPQGQQDNPFAGAADIKRTETELFVRDGQTYAGKDFKIADR